MSIDAGDATLQFLLNTTNFDQGLNSIESRVRSSVATSTQSVDQLQNSFDGAGKSAKNTGDIVDDAGKRMSNSTREAQAEARLLSEELGLNIPRHVTALIGQLPTLASAFTAAFGATAVLILLKSIGEVGEKIGDVLASTFVYTEAMKEQDKAVADLNRELEKIGAAYKAAKTAEEQFGASGSDLTRKRLELLQQEITQTQKGIEQSQAELQTQTRLNERYEERNNLFTKALDYVGAYFTGQQTIGKVTEKGVADQGKIADQLARQLQLQQEQSKVLQEQLAQEEKLEAIENNKTTGQARLALQKAQADASVAFDRDAAVKRILIQQQFEDQTYRLELSTLERKLSILKENDDNTKDEQAKVNAQILALQRTHNAQVIAEQTKLKDALENVSKAIDALPLTAQLRFGSLVPIIATASEQIENSLYKVGAAFDALGISSGEKLKIQLDTAITAFNVLKNAQVQDAGVMLQAQEKVLQATIAYKAAIGESSLTEQQALSRLQKSAALLNPQLTKMDQLWNQFIAEARQGGPILQRTFKTVGDQGKEAFLDLEQGVGSAAQAYATGSQTIGQALASMLQQELATISARAAIKAVEELAFGFATLFTNPPESAAHFESAAIFGTLAVGAGVAGRALSGAAGNAPAGSPTGTPVQTTTSPATQPQQRVQVQVSNVQKFAGGGLISGPTLAMIGDSKSGGAAREGVLPLDDPDAMKAIGSAIAAHIGGGGPQLNVYVKGMISPDNLSKVVHQINRRVRGNQLTLHASSSLRLNKRSQ